MKPANDNTPPDPCDTLVETLLKGNHVLEERIVKGLQVLMELRDVPRAVRLEVKEYMAAVIQGIRETEGQLIGLAHSIPRNQLGDAFGKSLEGYAERFAQLATTPDQEQLAETFHHFAAEVAGTIRQSAEKEPDLEM